MCGVNTVRGALRIFASAGRGSVANTSIAAPAIVPFSSAAASASRSTISPRAALTITAAGFIRDGHATRGGRGHVDVVDADTSAPHHHETLRRVHDRRRHLRFAAHDERVDVRDARDEVSLLQTGGLADLAARAEQRETLFGK